MAFDKTNSRTTDAAVVARRQHQAQSRAGAAWRRQNRAWTPIIRQPLWCSAVWFVLTFLVTWSYGANNVGFPGIPVPLVDVMVIALIIRALAWWRPFTATPPGRTILVLLVLLSAYGGLRLIADYPTHGLKAVRGCVFILEAWAILLGVGLARRLGRVNVERGISIAFGTALAWFCFYPVKAQVIELSPVVTGVQRSASLFSFTSAGFVSAWALLWFGTKQAQTSAVASAIAIGVVLMAQSRGVFAGLAVAALVLLVMSRSGATHVLLRRLVFGGVVLVALFAVLPPLPGRLGTVSVSTVTDLVRTGLGGEGGVASSFDDRVKWNTATISAIQEEELGWIFGVGLGADLTDGFGTAGVAVINPHNDFLEFYARLGLGVVPWVGLWLISFRTMFRRGSRGDRLALWGLSAAAVTVLVSLTQPFSSFAYGGMVWWLLVGMVLGSDQAGASRYSRRRASALLDPDSE